MNKTRRPRQSGPRWNKEEAVAFGRRLRTLREQAGLSQRELSFSGCTAAYISRVEKGERYPSVVLMRRMAERLKVAAEFLEFGEGVAPSVCAKADTEAINAAAERFGTPLRWEDLQPGERDQVTQGLDEALVDTLAARIHAVALSRSVVV